MLLTARIGSGTDKFKKIPLTECRNWYMKKEWLCLAKHRAQSTAFLQLQQNSACHDPSIPCNHLSFKDLHRVLGSAIHLQHLKANYQLPEAERLEFLTFFFLSCDSLLTLSSFPFLHFISFTVLPMSLRPLELFFPRGYVSMNRCTVHMHP